jgi:hypothetical protein
MFEWSGNRIRSAIVRDKNLLTNGKNLFSPYTFVTRPHNHSVMKTTLIFLLTLVLSTAIQGQTDWRTTGNDSEAGRFLGTTDYMPLVFKTNNAERMRITESGKFGFGTASPTEAFEVHGGFLLNGQFKLALAVSAGETQKRYLYVNSTGSTSWLKSTALTNEMYSHQQCIPKNEDGTGYPAPVWTNSGGLDHGILYTGEFCPAWVGIGIDVPVATLDVRGEQFISEKLEIGGQIVEDHKLYLNLIEENGLFINQSNPDGVTRSAFKIRSEDVPKTIFEINSLGEMTLVCLSSPTETAFRIQGLPSEDLFTVTTDGVAYSAGVIVKEAPFFPDYVFDEQYPLMSIRQLEQFIKTHHHLPNMPTASEVEANGADLYELTRVLTEKVEEFNFVCNRT